jgi:signal peptidase I
MKVWDIMLVMSTTILLIFIILASFFYIMTELRPVNYWHNVDLSIQCSGYELGDFIIIDNYVNSGSMRPYLNNGDKVLMIEYNPTKPLVVGDVVRVKVDEDYYVRHRVFGVTKNYFTMKGDNNRKADNRKYSYSNVTHVICGVLRGTI